MGCPTNQWSKGGQDNEGGYDRRLGGEIRESAVGKGSLAVSLKGQNGGGEGLSDDSTEGIGGRER